VELTHRDAHALGANPWADPKVALDPVLFWRIGTGTVRGVAQVDRAFVSVVAVDAITQADAPPFATSARIVVESALGAVHLVGIGTGPIDGVTDIVGAVVAIATVDVATQFSVHANPGLAYPPKPRKVALGPIGQAQVRASAVRRVADVLCAFVSVIAVDTLAEPYAHARKALPGITMKLTRSPVLRGLARTTTIGCVAGVVGARVAIVTGDSLAKADALGPDTPTWIAVDAAGGAVCHRRVGTTPIDGVTDVFGAVVVVGAIYARTKVALAAMNHQDETERKEPQESKHDPHHRPPTSAGSPGALVSCIGRASQNSAVASIFAHLRRMFCV
jgi:hypothetical protein